VGTRKTILGGPLGRLPSPDQLIKSVRLSRNTFQSYGNISRKWISEESVGEGNMVSEMKRVKSPFVSFQKIFSSNLAHCIVVNVLC